MSPRAKTGYVVVCLTLTGVASHLLPHPMGVSTIGAVGMLCAAYLPRGWSLIPVLATAAAGDALIGFYGLLAMSFVYLGHLAASVSVRRILDRINARAVGTAALASAVVFYLISNLTPMAMGYYPNTPEGWLACYANGLPYLWRGMLANLLFGGAAFGLIALIGASSADRIAAAKRD